MLRLFFCFISWGPKNYVLILVLSGMLGVIERLWVMLMRVSWKSATSSLKKCHLWDRKTKVRLKLIQTPLLSAIWRIFSRQYDSRTLLTHFTKVEVFILSIAEKCIFQDVTFIQECVRTTNKQLKRACVWVEEEEDSSKHVSFSLFSFSLLLVISYLG